VEQLLIIAGIIVGGTGAAAATGCALTVRTLRRANRVVADRPTPAPVTWLWSWQEPARLHRRLRRAVQAAGSAALAVEAEASGGGARRRRSKPTTPLSTLATEVAEQAAALDKHLASVSHVPRTWRSREMSAISGQVRELEASAYRLGQLAIEWRTQLRQLTPASPEPALELQTRLDALEAAIAEVAPLARGGLPADSAVTTWRHSDTF
jgi:hypothetical protein